MTQAQLAASCGLATITIQQYERDVRTPKIETLVDIANAVSVTLEYFVGMEEMDAREFGIKASDTFKNRDSEMIKDFWE